MRDLRKPPRPFAPAFAPAKRKRRTAERLAKHWWPAPPPPARTRSSPWWMRSQSSPRLTGCGLNNCCTSALSYGNDREVEHAHRNQRVVSFSAPPTPEQGRGREGSGD